MLLSIVVYTTLALSLFALGWHAHRREQRLMATKGKHLAFFSWEIVLSILLFACVAGARYHTGYDHAMYLHQYQFFQKYCFFTRDFEPLFMWVTQLMSSAHLHYFFYFALWAALQIGLIYYACRYSKFLLPWLGLYLMLGPFFLDWMNTMRQGVCECAFVFAVEFIQKRKFWPYLLVIATAALIHKSAILMLPLYLINKQPTINIKWAFVLMAVAVALGFVTSWLKLFDGISSLLSNFGSVRYADALQRLSDNGGRMVHWGPVRIMNLIIPCLIVAFYPKVKEHFAKEKLFPYYVLMVIIWFCVNNILVNTTVFMTRPFEYFKIFTLVANAYLLAYFFKTKRWAWLVVLCLLSFSNAYIDVTKAVAVPTEVNATFLYHFCFLR